MLGSIFCVSCLVDQQISQVIPFPAIKVSPHSFWGAPFVDFLLIKMLIDSKQFLVKRFYF